MFWNVIVAPRIDQDELTQDGDQSDGKHDYRLHQRVERYVRDQSHRDSRDDANEDIQRRDPSLPHTWFNLGLHYKQSNDLDRAAAQFTKLVQLAPDEPIAHYQLGAIHRALGRAPQAIAEFEIAAKLNPLLAAAHFQLYNLYRAAA